MNYSPKRNNLKSESVIKVLDTFDIELDNCIISGVFNNYIEYKEYEVYVSLDNGEGIIDIYYKIFLSEQEAKKCYDEIYERINKASNIKEILKNAN